MARLLARGSDRWEAQGVVAASSRFTSVSNGGTANTKGSWVQLDASTTFDVDAVLVHLQADALSVIYSSLVDIGIGAAASEQVIVPDIQFSSDQWCGRAASPILLPCKIPAGSRIAARHACSDANIGIFIGVHLINTGMAAMYPPGGKIVNYGATAADSGGIGIDPGATANTKGSWTQITASTNEDLRGVVIMIGNQNISKGVDAVALIDIGIGAAASEQIIIPDYAIGSDPNAELYLPLFSPILPCHIPAGSRIAARAQNSITTAGSRAFDVSILGVT